MALKKSDLLRQPNKYVVKKTPIKAGLRRVQRTGYKGYLVEEVYDRKGIYGIELWKKTKSGYNLTKSYVRKPIKR